MTQQQLMLIGAVGVLLVLAYLAGLATMAILVMGRDRDEDPLPPYRGHVPSHHPPIRVIKEPGPDGNWYPRDRQSTSAPPPRR